MPVWFLVVLLVVLAFAALLAITMRSRRSASGQNTTIVERRRSSDGQNTTIVERRPPSDGQNTTVVEGD